MAKISTSSKRITVTHPNFPELKVFCHLLEPVEAMDLFSGFQQYQKAVAVVDGKGNPILKENGDLHIATLTNLPSEAILSILEAYVDGFEGLEGDDGPIPFSKENLKYLFARELNIKKRDSKDKDKINTQSFPDYIQDYINKEQEEYTANEAEVLSAPKSKTSPKLR